MTCEWVEGTLSAYLDDALDPQVRDDVTSHLESCSHCQALLEDYRRDERLLRALPTIAPDERLRERIFDSREFAALARRHDARDVRSRVMRYALPAAALIALALGGGLIIRAHLAPQAHPNTAGHTSTIGAPNSFTYPLTPGQRVVFLRDGALWSAPETPTSAAATASAPQRLTPASARVVAWSVAPASGGHGGRLVAWVDGATGALHLVRADGLTDVVVAHVASAGHAPESSTLVSLVWSPDGTRLAFVSADAGGTLTLRTLSVSDPATVSGAQVSGGTATGPLVAAPVWSADSQSLAWTAASGSSQSVWTLRNGAVAQVSAQADPGSSKATVAALGWSGSSVTWASQSGGQITGVFAAVPGATSAARLTPAGARYTAAALGPSGWMLAGQGALWRVAPGVPPVWLAAIQRPISAIVWSPDGAAAALVAPEPADSQMARVALWSAGGGVIEVTATAASDATPAWSPDSQWLAYVAGKQVVIALVQDGRSAGDTTAGIAAAPADLAWSPDGNALAITGARGVYLASGDGQVLTLITSLGPSAGGSAWSTAG